MNNKILNHIGVNKKNLNLSGYLKTYVEVISHNQWLWDDSRELWWDDGKDVLFNSIKKTKKK